MQDFPDKKKNWEEGQTATTASSKYNSASACKYKYQYLKTTKQNKETQTCLQKGLRTNLSEVGPRPRGSAPPSVLPLLYPLP